VHHGFVADRESGQDGRLTALQAIFPPFSETAFTVDAAGNIYFTRSLLFDNRIFQLATDGSITTFGGTGSVALPGCGGVGDIALAKFGNTSSLASSLAVNVSGNLLVANGSLHEITPAGGVRRIAGQPPAFSGDGGPALSATLSNPHGLA